MSGRLRLVDIAWISAAHDMPSQPALVPDRDALRPGAPSGCGAVVLWLHLRSNGLRLNSLRLNTMHCAWLGSAPACSLLIA